MWGCVWLAALLAASAASGCDRRAAAGASRPVLEADVRRATVEDVFLLTGEVRAVRSRELAAPRVEGGGRFQIRWIADEGSEVESGQVVVELDNAEVAQGLEEKRLNLAQAAITLEERKATLQAEVAQKRLELERARLEADKAAIEAAVPQELRSRKEWHEKQQALRKAEAGLEKAGLALSTLEATGAAELEGMSIALEKADRAVRQAELSLRELSVRAPTDGIVLIGRSPMEDRPLEAGDNIWPGLRLASIPDLGAMEIEAYLPEVDEGRIAPGLPARVIVDAYPDRSIAGRVEEVAAVAQDLRYASGFRVRVSLAERQPGHLVPGLSARVEVVRRVFEDALVVPRGALVRDGASTGVRLSSGEGLDVEIGACLPLDCVVESGLAEGDRVALP